MAILSETFFCYWHLPDKCSWQTLAKPIFYEFGTRFTVHVIVHFSSHKAKLFYVWIIFKIHAAEMSKKNYYIKIRKRPIAVQIIAVLYNHLGLHQLGNEAWIVQVGFRAKLKDYESKKERMIKFSKFLRKRNQIPQNFLSI